MEFEQFKKKDTPLVWAHRGASAYAPENTLEAFRLAIEQGADGIELDVQLTIDGEDICMVPFVKKTLKNVVVGAVKALDGYEDGKEIIIKIK